MNKGRSRYRWLRALRKGVIVGPAIGIGMGLVELGRAHFGHLDISLLSLLLLPGLSLVEAVRGWDSFRHMFIAALFVDLFLYSAGATLWFAARSRWSARYEEASGTGAAGEVERVTLAGCAKSVAFFLVPAMLVSLALPYPLRMTVRPLEMQGLKFYRPQPNWLKSSQSAPIVVIGTVTDASESWWPTFVRTNEGAVRDLRQQRIELSVEHRLRGSAIPEQLTFYRWVELSQSYAKLLLNLNQPFIDPLGSSGVGKGRHIFFLVEENGDYRAFLDITETGFRVRSGRHDTLPGNIESLERLLAGILLTPAPGYSETEFTENLRDSFETARALVGKDEALKHLEALLEHPSIAVRGEACLAAGSHDRDFLETCAENLVNGPPEYHQRAQEILDYPKRHQALIERWKNAAKLAEERTPGLPLPPLDR